MSHKKLLPKPVDSLLQLLRDRGGEASFKSIGPHPERQSYFAASLLAAERGLVAFIETDDGHGGVKLTAPTPEPAAEAIGDAAKAK